MSVLALSGCRSAAIKVDFDSAMEVSGQKFALKDVAPELPSDWSGYEYLVIEYKISTTQRFQLGLSTASGYNDLRIMCYVTNAWNRLVIPLDYYSKAPAPAIDMAATNNHPRYTGWINNEAHVGKPLNRVDSIGIRMRKPIGKPSIEIRSISLSAEDPGDAYFEAFPAVDEFGQAAGVSYPAKVLSLKDLKVQWAAEEEETVSTEAYNYSKFGGYLQKQLKATGYFRTEMIDGRWWFVDPEGHPFLSYGVDCVGIGGGGEIRDADKREGMFKELPPAELMDRLGSRVPDFGLWNQYRRFGASFPEKGKDLVFKRMDKWGLNTIANWSDRSLMNMNRKAFLLPLGGLGLQSELMGLCDVYESDFEEKLDKSLARSVTPYKDNPWLIGYYLGNEPSWFKQESRLCELILSGHDRPIKSALSEYLSREGDSAQSRKAFIHKSFRTFLMTADRLLKKHDPHHLNLGIRFGNLLYIDEDLLRLCGEAFDVLSFNCYELCPSKEMMDRGLELSGLPMIIGEYHFGTVDRGLAQSLWQVDSQQERGQAFRYYTEQAYAHPGLIGTGYFQWCDQDLMGRMDGENFNCGLVDVTDRPYAEMVSSVMETAKVLYDVHIGTVKPYSHIVESARGFEAIPDLWNK